MRGVEVPELTEDFTADPVELFFDLAFVFAFSQLVSHLVHHPTWEGASEAGLLFLMLWFPWSTFTWSANAVSGNARPVRAIFLIATATTVPMAASVTTAYDAGGFVFGAAGAVILAMAIGLQVGSLDQDSEAWQAVIRYSLPNVLVMILLLAGGIADDTLRVVLWVAAMAVIIGATIDAGGGDWIVRSGHFAERHGLIVIIALGEVVVAIGIAVVDSLQEGGSLSSSTKLALTAAGVLAGLMWWAFFDRFLPGLEHRSGGLTGNPASRFMRDVYTYFHIPIVAGIILIAAAAEEILLHPSDPVDRPFRVMLAGGFALFLGGVIGAVGRAFRVVAKERVAAIAALTALVVIASSWDGVVLLIAVDVVLFVVLVAEHLRIEGPKAVETA